MAGKNKGLDFEHAVMYAATSRINEPRSRENQDAFEEASKKWSSIEKPIQEIPSRMKNRDLIFRVLGTK